MVSGFVRGVSVLGVLAVWSASGCRDGSPSEAGHALPALEPTVASRSELSAHDRDPPPQARRSPTGLTWVRLSRGAGDRRPRTFDRVSIEYTSWNPDGSIYATSRKRGVPALLRVDDASPGFQEALTQMVAGEKRRVWIPEGLARSRLAGPKGALIAEIELLEVVPEPVPPPPPADLAAAPADAERTASGLASRQLEPPTRDVRAERHDRARITYVGWDASGRVFDSSAPRGPFVEVTLTHGAPGWQEALSLLREGERRRFWIPQSLAYDAAPGAVRGQLVYDIELVEIVDAPAPPKVPEDVGRPPRSAHRLPSGVAYRVLERGPGTVKVGEDGSVDVHYTYWTQSGTLVDSTLPNGRPQRAELEDRDLPPGVAQVVAGMVAGERRRIWVPEALGYAGAHPFKGPLVFDLQVIAVYHGEDRVDWIDPSAP